MRKPIVPSFYVDKDERLAYISGWFDAKENWENDPGAHPVQPYSRGYWESVADTKENGS